jgi:uncharacterized protein RhaS with RHS repeats
MAMYDSTIGRWLSEDPIGFEAGDGNLSRYVGNIPTLKVDPSGLAAEEKQAGEASGRAKELEKILPNFIDKLKQIAKDTKELERFGVILKARDPMANPQHKFLECVSKEATQTSSALKWWNSEKEYGGRMLKPGPDGKVDLDRERVTENDIDNGYPIEFDWHTHPHFGDPWPSTKDSKMCKDNNIVGIMIIYIGRMRAGKVEDGWAIWIVDTDGKAYEYTPPPMK